MNSECLLMPRSFHMHDLLMISCAIRHEEEQTIIALALTSHRERIALYLGGCHGVGEGSHR